MLARRIIPCLDVQDNKVVKGVQFSSHQVVGDILELAKRYAEEGADELVFYDITASSENRSVTPEWIQKTAKRLEIPFCVAGGIRTVEKARQILNVGADKISINSPALERPELINDLVSTFGSQCVVVGVDSRYEDGKYVVYQYTGSESTLRSTRRNTLDWIQEVQDRGAGEVVLNCMNQDGMKQGYNIAHLCEVRELLSIPLIASGGAGRLQDFADVFTRTDVDGALAAGVFHRQEVSIPELKQFLKHKNIEVRI